MNTSRFNRSNKHDENRLKLNLGRTKRYLEEGLSIPEIAVKLKVGESTVRKWVDIINNAKETK